MTRPIPPTTTEEHKPPTTEHVDGGKPVLLVAYPRPAILPLPPMKQPVGRAWLGEAGFVDAKVSSQHLAFFSDSGHLRVEDLGSRNCTFRDGHRLVPHTKVPVEDGTVLRIGGTILVYREAYRGPGRPEEPLGGLIGPFGLTDIREDIAKLTTKRGSSVVPVLIEGPTGTGKEALAREVARALDRLKKYTAVNVGGIPETLFEGQLFGWEKGSHSGAVNSSPGVLRSHKGGTVFLDELGELPLGTQPKLLRVLDGHGVLPVGGLNEIPVDVALVAATNRDLSEWVEQGIFRRDLLSRFSFRISLPSLAERAEDIFAIVKAIWPLRHKGSDLEQLRVDVEAVELLMLQDWPGNVRDLDRLVISMDPTAGLRLSAVAKMVDATRPKAPPPTVAEIEKAIAAAGGNKSAAAKKLGISRGFMNRRLGGK